MDGFVTLGNLNDTVSRGSGNYFVHGYGGDGGSNGALEDKTIIRRNKTDILGLGNRNDYLDWCKHEILVQLKVKMVRTFYMW